MATAPLRSTQVAFSFFAHFAYDFLHVPPPRMPPVQPLPPTTPIMRYSVRNTSNAIAQARYNPLSQAGVLMRFLCPANATAQPTNTAGYQPCCSCIMSNCGSATVAHPSQLRRSASRPWTRRPRFYTRFSPPAGASKKAVQKGPNGNYNDTMYAPTR